MRSMLQVLASLVVLGCSALAVQAGVVLQMKESKPGSKTPGQQINMYIDAGKLRIDIGEHRGKKTAMIFDQAKQVMWMIDHSRGSYMGMTAADLQRMKQQLDSAMKQMEAQMAQMPPEQRRMIEKMMKQKMGMAKPSSITMQVKSRGEKVGRYVCTLYEVLSDGQRTQEVWAAPFAEAQLGKPSTRPSRPWLSSLNPFAAVSLSAAVGRCPDAGTWKAFRCAGWSTKGIASLRNGRRPRRSGGSWNRAYSPCLPA